MADIESDRQLSECKDSSCASHNREDNFHTDGKKYLDDVTELRQIPSEAPGIPAAIEDSSADIPPDGGYGWVCVACGFMVGMLLKFI
jgi:hypothetical protein